MITSPQTIINDFAARAALNAQSTQTPTARAEVFCETIGRTPPASLFDTDGGPSDEVMTLCSETGLSLDWLYRGRVLVAATGKVHHGAA
ncbi:MAG: hypothetical protein Q7J57_18525 [Gemmobacter sp.]|nr:hypothetical protein [Gemmobacter sp.]